VETTYVDATDLDAWKNAVRPNTRAFLVESPANPLLEVDPEHYETYDPQRWHDQAFRDPGWRGSFEDRVMAFCEPLDLGSQRDLMRLSLATAPRLRNIAEIGVRTFGWAYRNRGLPVPPLMPSVRLDTPFGEAWQWAGSTGNSVQGDAVAFCQVVTQTRNVADTGLSVTGETARHWMTIVQCFAGPPETPPAPGSRHRSHS
jgi:hypothetical protein